jgi:hypothetical protein
MSARLELAGKRFGKLVVMGLDHVNEVGTTVWVCKCDCDRRITVRGYALKNGNTTSCGCSKRLDLTGQRFGRLIVVRFSHVDAHRTTRWRCQCDCGKVTVVDSNSLQQGMTKSCGCLLSDSTRERATRHGDCADFRITKEYRAWQGMKARCSNPNQSSYKHYGGRGIRVCSRWRRSFKNFLSDVGRAPDHRLSIDRKNNNGNYEPGNCRWATQSEQIQNRRPRLKQSA